MNIGYKCITPQTFWQRIVGAWRILIWAYPVYTFSIEAKDFYKKEEK